MASCTALTLKALPIPPPIKIHLDEFFHKKGFQTINQGEDLIKTVQKKSIENVKLNFRMPIFKIIGLSSNQLKQAFLNQSIQEYVTQEFNRKESILENKLASQLGLKSQKIPREKDLQSLKYLN